MVLVVIDSNRSPINQVNITILGNLDARNIPLLIVSNKIDLKSSSTSRVRTAFPGYDVIGISAKTGAMVNELYKMILKKI